MCIRDSGQSRPLATEWKCQRGLTMEEKAAEYMRYFAFYNWQYRLCCPTTHGNIDSWQRCEDVVLSDDHLNALADDEWFVGRGDIKPGLHSLVDVSAVDWQHWETYPSSMLLPRKLNTTIPAFGGKKRARDPEDERLFFIRSPVCINFAGWSYLAGRYYTGKDVLEAWRQLPLVKWGKSNSGPAGLKKRTERGW